MDKDGGFFVGCMWATFFSIPVWIVVVIAVMYVVG